MILVNPEKDNRKVTYKVKYTDYTYADKIFNGAELITIEGLLLSGKELADIIDTEVKERHSYRSIRVTDIEILAIEDIGEKHTLDIKSVLKDLAVFQMFLNGFKPNEIK